MNNLTFSKFTFTVIFILTLIFLNFFNLFSNEEKGRTKPHNNKNVSMKFDLSKNKTTLSKNVNKRFDSLIKKQKNILAWDAIKSEGFEGNFPNDWNIFVTSGYADSYWGKTKFKAYADSASCWCADDGSEKGDAGGTYKDNMLSWMIYGPFDLSDAFEAEVIFHHWSKTETDYDYLFYGASINEENFYGNSISGDWTQNSGNINGWLTETFDLTNVYTIGNLAGQSQVWIAFVFSSDETINDQGVYLDEITIQKNIAQGDPEINISPSSLDFYQDGGGNLRSASKEKKMNADDKENKHRRGLIIPDYAREYWLTHKSDLKYDATKFMASVDWSENDSPIKDQSNCGSCWAFAAVALIENLSDKNDLSEQVIVSCTEWDCDGGWYFEALDYIKNEGIPPENCYPYIEQNGNCQDKCSVPDYLVKLTDFSPDPGLWGENMTVNDLKSQLQLGPLCIAFLVPEDGTFDQYSGGIYNYNGGTIDWGGNAHAVLLVGYDDSGQYFKVKNSWGADWGENGYFRIAFDDVADDVQFGMYGCAASGVYTEGDNNFFKIENLGSGMLEIDSIFTDKSWLSFYPQSVANIIPGGEKNIIVSIKDWNAVSYPQETGKVTIKSNDADEPEVSVDITAHKGQAPNTVLVVSPLALAFTTNQGGVNPEPQNLNIGNGGTGTLNWNITHTETPAGWLIVTPVNGSATTETDIANVSINSAGLMSGSYEGTLTITALNASGSPKIVNVSLEITGEGPCSPPSISASDVVGLAGDTVIVDINIDQNQNEIDAFGFQFTYCSDKLSLIELQKGSLNTHFSFFQGKENPPGTITIGGFDTTPIPADTSGSIVKLKMYVNLCTEHDTCTLKIQNLTDDLIGLNICPGYFICRKPCSLGDVNMDDQITVNDALCAFQIYMNDGVVPVGECSTYCALDAADVDCTPDGITPSDALYIFKAYLNGEDPPIDCEPMLLLSKDNSVKDLKLTLNQIENSADDELTFAIQVNNPEGMQAFGLDLGFPDDKLSFIEVTNTNQTNSWLALEGVEKMAGVVSIGGFNSEKIASSKSANLATVKFKTNEAAQGDVELWIFNLLDDLSRAELSSDIFTFSINQTEIKKLESQGKPKTYALKQNYPNPFNMQTEIIYQVPDPVFVTLTIYNSMGQNVRTLISQKQDAGVYSIKWDGRNDLGAEMVSGIYLYKLSTTKFVDTKKLILLK